MGPESRRLIIPPISPAAPGALYDQIIQGLKKEISEGRIPPGAALPSFRGLAEDLLVSVITVKRAYEELEREGIIYRRQGLGTFVAEAAGERARTGKAERARALVREAVQEAAGAGLTTRELIKYLQEVAAELQEPTHVRQRR